MPNEAQRQAIENNRLGLRIVDDGGKFDSGSCYYLFPVDDDWDAELLGTCRVYASAAAPNKKLHLLGKLNLVESGKFKGTLTYGRLTGKPESIAAVSLYGGETDESIARWVLKEITSLVPSIGVVTPVTNAAVANQPSAFATCCTSIAYIFTCCLPGYALLADDSDGPDYR